jgi:hypothetical protein
MEEERINQLVNCIMQSIFVETEMRDYTNREIVTALAAVIINVNNIDAAIEEQEKAIQN